ncbi:MAG: hypothetical protein A2Y62_06860 [Candidatus Fischerbacteria bacterium RBG_13_37_8]|uniref:DUF5050 domain-containing protein n=1 Tax=Candidatus Fischerbacteria bacterium RBG_13_37_8 TaxID=1817863 RepID=A0A1F5VMA4_9BACT|nr:MAG: hypothetical protein A2Y62_06860 [Candidatus Fischerbacteria bacterium RBG_13_37_8]
MKKFIIIFLMLIAAMGCDKSETEKQTLTSAEKIAYAQIDIPDYFQGRIVFQSDADGDYELYLLDWNGVKKLTDNNYQDEYPMWSPDNELISFQANPKAESDCDIFVMKPDGTEIKAILATTKWEGQASWSADGTAMVVTLDKARIYWLDMERKDVVKVHSLYGETIMPALAPDGTIVFSMRKWQGWNIVAYDRTKNSVKYLTRDRKSCRGRISHKGDRIVYVSRTVSNISGDIWIMNLDGSDKRRITMNDSTSEYYPTWSPDDRYIAYCVTLDEKAPNWSLWIMNIETGETQMIYDT